jgi:mannose/fructose-specific phosphotransferase system component IIA
VGWRPRAMQALRHELTEVDDGDGPRRYVPRIEDFQGGSPGNSVSQVLHEDKDKTVVLGGRDVARHEERLLAEAVVACMSNSDHQSVASRPGSHRQAGTSEITPNGFTRTVVTCAC